MAQAAIVGRRGERLAAWYLRAKGYSIVAHNYRVKGGEIDLVCRRGRALIFIEVKTRSNRRGGYPEEAVTGVKLQRLRHAAAWYMQQSAITYREVRFEVVSVEFFAGCLPRILHLTDISFDAN